MRASLLSAGAPPGERALALWLTIWGMHLGFITASAEVLVSADVPLPSKLCTQQVPGGSIIFAFRTL